MSGTDCTTNNGNVMNQWIQPLNIFQNYGYDALNRISVMEESTSASATPACGAGTTPCRGFSYDDWSNMYVSATRVMSPASFTPTSSSWFDTNNRLVNTSLGIVHDSAGNQTAIGGFTFAYDHEGRVKTSTLNSIQTNYTYDGDGRRVTKSTGGSTTTFVYDASGNLAAEYGGTPPSESGPRYLTADHLGSTRLVTKDDGTPDRRIDYLPFGEFMPATVGGRTTAMKYEATETLAALTQRFTGKERDSETGLDYFGARYFVGAQGRFISADAPFADQKPEDPQSWNLYAYTRGNPLRYIDSNGEAVVDAGRVRIGTASFRVYKQQARFDAAAMLSTFWPIQQGPMRQFQQNQSSYWYPTQNNAGGGCTLGCATAFTEQAVGITIDLSFNYDKNDNLTGATISWAPDPNASFIGPTPALTTSTLSMMPGGQSPMPQALRVDVNSSALRNLTPQQLRALATSAGNIPVAAVRQARTQAISEEQRRRVEEEKKKACEAGGSDCRSSN